MTYKLPKKYNRREANVDSTVGKWFLKNWPHPVVYEVKMYDTGVLKDHQKKLIQKIAKTRKFHYKFPDMGRRTPLDGVSIPDCDVAVCWVRGSKVQCEINDIQEIEFTIKKTP